MKKKSLIVFIMIVLGIFKTDLVCAENIYKEYIVGNEVTHNGMKFYVIENSSSTSDSVKLLKAAPLTTDEVNKYGGVGTANNHVNMYSSLDYVNSYHQTASDIYGYGGMAYYSSVTCGYDAYGNYSFDGCTTDYDKSEIKYIVDAWASDKLAKEDLKVDSTGYGARLITYEELITNLGYNKDGTKTKDTPSWIYLSYGSYWTMSQYKNYSSSVFSVNSFSEVNGDRAVYTDRGMVRPVINLKKDLIGTKKELTDKEFKIGDIIQYNNMLFYVIKDSDSKKNYVTLLKVNPLTVAEINKYGDGHVNMYIPQNWTCYQKASDQEGYGGMTYYSSSTCVYSDVKEVLGGCTTDYAQSEVKYVIDAWALDKLDRKDLKEDSTGYSVRLLTKEELIENLDYKIINNGSESYGKIGLNTPSWVADNAHKYWTMSSFDDTKIWGIQNNGLMVSTIVNYAHGLVRPVITLKKINYDNQEDKLEDEFDKDVEDGSNKEIEEEINETIDNNNEIIRVPDTLLNNKIIFGVMGIALIITSIVVVMIIRKIKYCTKKINDK